MKLVVSALVALALVPVAAAADVTIVSRDVPLHPGGRSLAAAAPRRFNMVGLHWQGSGAPFFRTRAAGGRWSKWLEADDDWGRSGSWRKSNPEWTGTANAIQYQAAANRRGASPLSKPRERSSPIPISANCCTRFQQAALCDALESAAPGAFRTSELSHPAALSARQPHNRRARLQ